MNGSQLRTYIVEPVLRYLDPVIPFSEGAVELVMGTAAQESALSHIDQLAPGPGPAYGFWQMEAATHDDLWRNFIDRRAPLQALMVGLLALWPSRIDQLRSNVAYAAAMCRVHYRRAPQAIPPPDDIAALGRMWKDAYNTSRGKGTVDQFVRSYAMVQRHGEVL